MVHKNSEDFFLLYDSLTKKSKREFTKDGTCNTLSSFAQWVPWRKCMELTMDLGISGKKAIVCGSSRGLGKACASSLARAGCKVVINGMDAKRLSETASE